MKKKKDEVELNATFLQQVCTEHFRVQADRENEKLNRAQLTNRASGIGACSRLQFYKRMRAAESAPWYTPRLIAVFAAGKMWEQGVANFLFQMGFDLTRQQGIIDNHQDFKKVNITGHIDFIINYWKNVNAAGPEKAIADVKSFNTYVFQEAAKGIDNWKNVCWLQKYPDQLQIYMHGTNIKKGVFILVDKNQTGNGGLPLFIDCPYSRKRIRQLIEKAAFINHCCARGEEPPRIDFGDECLNCPFIDTVCLPEKSFDLPTALASTIGDQIAAALKVRDKLSTAVEMHKDADARAKRLIKTIDAEEMVIPAGFAITKKPDKNGTERITIKKIGGKKNE
jgi:hypothetical protein